MAQRAAGFNFGGQRMGNEALAPHLADLVRAPHGGGAAGRLVTGS